MDYGFGGLLPEMKQIDESAGNALRVPAMLAASFVSRA
jgi:hypothetical protein